MPSAALASVGERATWVALERVREELVKMMRAPKPSRGFELLREAGLLGLWMPELQRCYGVPHWSGRHRAKPVPGRRLSGRTHARGNARSHSRTTWRLRSSRRSTGRPASQSASACAG